MSIRKKQELEQLISDVHLNNLNYHSREIYLHSFFHCDENNGETGVDYRMSVDFVKNLHVLSFQSALPIVVHMHSIGGSWNDGMAIFDSIRFSTCPITILGYAQASSMTGIIIQSADKRILSPNCEFMIHHGSLSVSESFPAVKAFVEMNDKYCKRMLQIFARRATKSSKYFKEKKFTEEKTYNFISKKLYEKTDWYMDAEEAVFYGFADGILGTKGFESAERLKCETKFKGNLMTAVANDKRFSRASYDENDPKGKQIAEEWFDQNGFFEIEENLKESKRDFTEIWDLKGIHPIFGEFRIESEIKKDWGTKWFEMPFKWPSMDIPFRKREKADVHATHHMVIGGDLKRLFIVPRKVVLESPVTSKPCRNRNWEPEPFYNVQLPCEHSAFYFKTDDKWIPYKE